MTKYLERDCSGKVGFQVEVVLDVVQYLTILLRDLLCTRTCKISYVVRWPGAAYSNMGAPVLRPLTQRGKHYWGTHLFARA